MQQTNPETQKWFSEDQQKPWETRKIIISQTQSIQNIFIGELYPYKLEQETFKPLTCPTGISLVLTGRNDFQRKIEMIYSLFRVQKR